MIRLELLGDVAMLLVMPFLLTGLINRVKALWSGRKGPPLFQPLWDVLRLLRKTPVYSVTTTPIFRIAPWVLLISSLASAMVTPLLGSTPLMSFPFDFVVLAYAWGLGRVAVMLAALDTGSSFEGMGAAREATFSTLVEPALFLVIGALGLFGHTHTLAQALRLHVDDGGSVVAWVSAVVCLLVILQVETARMPVDDPTTHLELTMVHEVMILDHNGPELAAIQYANGVKLLVGAAIIATLVNPLAGTGSVFAAALTFGLCLLVAVVVGTVESLIARLKLRAVPQYVAVAIAAGAVALLATTWRLGGPR